MLNLGTEGHTPARPLPGTTTGESDNEQPRIFENGNPEDNADNLFESYRQTGLDDDYRRYTIALRQLGIATQQYHKLAEMAE